MKKKIFHNFYDFHRNVYNFAISKMIEMDEVPDTSCKIKCVYDKAGLLLMSPQKELVQQQV
jgi:hypothetical protein